MSVSAPETQISCQNVWKVFGPYPEQIEKYLDAGLSKQAILDQTGHVVAVKGVSFDVCKGETFVVMGLSGSGKSTLVRCISRLIEPTKGQILLDGEDIMAMNDKQLRELRRHKMSMVFQHFGLFPHRQIIDNVAYGLEVQGLKKAARHDRARQVLELVGLAGWENYYPGELSGGMQQRVGIARALAVDPEIMLFDEPFSALDPLIRRDMQDELINLQKRLHKTIIFITHDFLEAVKLGDRIAIMKDGEVVQIGASAEIIMHPANSYVREFTKDVPRTRVLDAGSMMKTPQVVALASDSPEQVREALHSKGCNLAFVVDTAGKFLGTLSLAQVDQPQQRLEGVAAGTLVGQLPYTISPNTLLATLIRTILISNEPAAVVDEQMQLLGMVDRTSVLLALTGQSDEGE